MQTDLLDRTPPNNPAAERGLVGSLLLDPRRLDDIPATLQQTDFHDGACGRLYAHLRAMADARDRIDATPAPLPSEQLLQGRKTIEISHNGTLYRLQATKLGKLILTK